MEYAPCGSLWDKISTESTESTLQMPEQEVGWWARQMVAAVEWLHGIGYAHRWVISHSSLPTHVVRAHDRDVKPHNFLLYPDSTLKITDFGSAARILGGKVDPKSCGLPVGTPDYIAHEILAHAEATFSLPSLSEEEGAGEVEPYTPSVDLWSLGVTLYEMAAGNPPFWSVDIPQTYQKIRRIEYTIPAGMSPSLRSLISA